MPKLTDSQHRSIAFWGMAMIAMGLPLSIFLVSVGTFVLAGNWLLEGQYKKRLKKFFTNPLSLTLISVFVVFSVGTIWSQNVEYSFRDLRVKLPLLLMPLLLFTSKLPSKKQQQNILFLFVLACVVGTIFGAGRYFELWGGELINKRQVSVFISHIRFGLMLTFSFFILAYFLYAKWNEWSVAEKVICLLTMAWILWFLIILEAFTAYAAFAVLLSFSLFWILIKQPNRSIKTGAFLMMVLGVITTSLYVKNIANNHFQEVPFDYRTQKEKTLNGRLYAHQKDVLYRENGHRVWNYVCWEELRNEWPKLSSVDFDSTDLKGQEIKFTAIRYITSKGLTKDSVGLHQLSASDISNIERGFTNYRYTDKLGVSRRIDQLFWAFEEYSWQQNANNSSTLQRLIYTQVGWSIFKENPILGVGTGDVIDAYKAAYSIDNRGMEKQFQGISHNQFLTVGITLGIVGLVIFLFSLIYPLLLYKRDYLYVMFVLLMVVSFLTDNTLDRQSGVTLFAFFNAFLIVRREFAETPD